MRKTVVHQGLLKVPSGYGNVRLVCALAAEFIGTLIFSLYGSAVTLQGTTESTLNNSLGNGLSLAVLIYCTANVSGGHLNPAVTLAACCSGYISVLKAIAYVVSQICGGICGSLLLAGLLHPQVSVGKSRLPSGCFGKEGIDSGQLFGWELVMTFVLVSTVFAVALEEPHFGNTGPLAIGLSLLCAVQAAGKFTGGALNPARALGPSIVFTCNWRTTWVYVLAELAGAALAGLASLPLYGLGPLFRTDPDSTRHQTDESNEREAELHSA